MTKDFFALAVRDLRTWADPTWLGMTDEEYRVIRQQNQRIYDRYQHRLREERDAREQAAK
jgi:hypothetical protein